MDLWTLGFVANAVVMTAYLAIAGTILAGIARTKQWRGNPLALATGLIFLSCGIGHGVHAYHAIETWDPAVSTAQRSLLSEWHVWAADGATAIIAIWYFTLRNRFPALVRGAALFEDMQVRRRQALEIHDNIVQSLVKAKMSLEMGQGSEGAREIEESLAASRRIMSELLGEAGDARPIRPGELVRTGRTPEGR